MGGPYGLTNLSPESPDTVQVEIFVQNFISFDYVHPHIEPN